MSHVVRDVREELHRVCYEDLLLPVKWHSAIWSELGLVVSAHCNYRATKHCKNEVKIIMMKEKMESFLKKF